MSDGIGAGNLFGGIGGLAAYLTSEGGEDQYKYAVDVWNKIRDPNFDWTSLSAPELKIAAVLDPQTYEAVVPAEMKQVVDSTQGRAAQAEALQGWQTISREGLPGSERIAAEEAQRAVRQAHQQAIESGIRSLQERGQAGGGAETAMRLGAAQQTANLAREQGNDLMQQAVNNRLAALGQMGQAGTELRGQDVAVSQAQADTWNRFHQWLSELQTQAAKDAATQRAAASQYNVQTAQQVANANPILQYQAQLENLNRKNQLAQQGFANQVTRAAGTTGALQELGKEKDRAKQALMNVASGVGQGIGSPISLGSSSGSDSGIGSLLSLII